MLRLALLLGFLHSAIFSAALAADVIKIPVAQQAAANSGLPIRGNSAAQVVQRFGEPKSREPSVGTPPISRWHYEEFTVIFESNVVVASVAHFKPKFPVEASSPDNSSDASTDNSSSSDALVSPQNAK